MAAGESVSSLSFPERLIPSRQNQHDAHGLGNQRGGMRAFPSLQGRHQKSAHNINPGEVYRPMAGGVTHAPKLGVNPKRVKPFLVP